MLKENLQLSPNNWEAEHPNVRHDIEIQLHPGGTFPNKTSAEWEDLSIQWKLTF